MAVYTVHQPPLKNYEAAEPERFVFVRDGFSFWALLFGPLWMLRHRMWLVLIGYLVLAGGLQFVLNFVGASSTVETVTGLLIAILVGMEAGTLRRFTLWRRRWQNLGVIVGDDRDSAERRFFDSWMQRQALMPQVAVTSQPPGVPPARGGESDVIGLFPQPGTSP
jgi:hypothetical protein